MIDQARTRTWARSMGIRVIFRHRRKWTVSAGHFNPCENRPDVLWRTQCAWIFIRYIGCHVKRDAARPRSLKVTPVIVIQMICVSDPRIFVGAKQCTCPRSTSALMV